jgi:hypothetical protein
MLGATAENIKAALDGSISFDECLNRIADIFSDSEEQFNRTQSEFVVVDSFIKGVPARAEILSYLSGCEITEVEEIEELRDQLYHLVDVSYRNPSDASNREMGYLWIKFQRDFADHFAARHDAVMRSHALQASYGEILRSDAWWECENLARIRLFDPRIAAEVDDVRRIFRELDCDFPVRDALQTRPFCRCSFGLANQKDLESLPDRLNASIQRALRLYREALFNQQKIVTPLLEEIENESVDKDASAAATFLIDALRKGEELPRFSLVQLQTLQRALGTLSDGPDVKRMSSTDQHFGNVLPATTSELEDQTVSV